VREFSSLADALVVKGLLRCRCKRRAFTSKKKSTAAALAATAPHPTQQPTLVGRAFLWLGWAGLGCQGAESLIGHWLLGSSGGRSLPRFGLRPPVGCSLQPRTTRTSLVAAKHLTDPTHVVIHQRPSTLTPKPTPSHRNDHLGKEFSLPTYHPRSSKPSQARPGPAQQTWLSVSSRVASLHGWNLISSVPQFTNVWFVGEGRKTGSLCI
jgi:hypothetical protein